MGLELLKEKQRETLEAFTSGHDISSKLISLAA